MPEYDAAAGADEIAAAAAALGAMLRGERPAEPVVLRRVEAAAAAASGGDEILAELEPGRLAGRPWRADRVRVSPGPDFFYSEPRLAATARAGQVRTSEEVALWYQEFLGRLLAEAGCSAAANTKPEPLVYAGGEAVYLQASVPTHLQARAAAFLAGFAEVFLSGAPRPVAEAQGPRVWVSAAGTVSALHYDADWSALAQASGTKRLLFFPAADLDRIYPYPDGHPLRRRGRVDLTAADLAGDGAAKYPLARGLAAWEAVLGPGDAVAFPPRWAHYTESRSLSASLTWRFRAGAEADTEHGREV